MAEWEPMQADRMTRSSVQTLWKPLWKRLWRTELRSVVFVILLVTSACITASARRYRSLDHQLKPEVATASPEDIARKWGPPADQQTIGATTFWTYYWAGGSKTVIAPVAGTLITRTRDRYDKVILQFRDGHLADYSIEVSR